MAVDPGILILAFAVLSSIALGAATAWLVVWKSKKPILWALTPVFAIVWLLLVAGPMLCLGFAGPPF